MTQVQRTQASPYLRHSFLFRYFRSFKESL
jgi:hypothetical protein